MQGFEVMIPIVLFGSIAAVFILYFSYRNRERMAMIEKGLNPSDLKGISLSEFFRSRPLNSLKWGLLTMFVGIGLIVAMLLDEVYMLEEPLYFGSMLIFGGLALVLFYVIASKKQPE